MLLRKKLTNGWTLAAYSRQTTKARGILVGSHPAGSSDDFSPVVKIMSDNSGKTYLVINKDKLDAMNAEIIYKTSKEMFEPLGFER